MRAGMISGIAKSALVLAAIAGGLLVAVLITDIHEDRTYKLVITGAVSVYVEPVVPDRTHFNPVITVLGPRDEAEVRRISREDGWVRVRLPDKREGYIFLDAPIELRRR